MGRKKTKIHGGDRGGRRPKSGKEPTKAIRVPESLAEPIKGNIERIREFLGVPTPPPEGPKEENP